MLAVNKQKLEDAIDTDGQQAGHAGHSMGCGDRSEAI